MFDISEILYSETPNCGTENFGIEIFRIFRKRLLGFIQAYARA